MKQKKMWISAGIATFLVLAVCLYFYFFSKPTEFLNEEVLIETINSYYSNPDSIEIQDVVFLGETHAFVPFISEKEYGMSYWVWKKRSWELGGMSMIQQPIIWKVDPKDPSTYVVLWNIEPDNDMTTFDIYLLNRRGYLVSENVHRYIPRVQRYFTVPFETEETSYGVEPLPHEWIAFLDSFEKVENSKQPSSLFFDYFQPSSIDFRWIPYNESGEITFPAFKSGTGHGFGKIHLHYLSSIQEHELE